MTSRLLAPLFRPATALVGRLRYAQKFVVVGIVLLVPLGLVAFAYVQQQRAQIAFSARERQGVVMLAPLITLTADAALARHEVATGGRASGLDRDIAAVDAVEGRLGATLRSSDEWRSVRAVLGAARSGTGRPADRFAAYNRATEALLALIVHVGDESNLTLDPDLDTYYLMDLLQFRLPVLLDTAGHSVDRAVLERGGADNDALIELGLDNGVLDTTRKAIGRAAHTVAAKTADPRVSRMVLADLTRLDAATVELSDALGHAVQTRDPGAVIADGATGVRADAARFAADAATALDGLLRKRIDGFATRAHQVELVTGLAALLGIYLFVAFYLGVAPPIRRIVATLHAVAGGDLTRRVSVDTHDELSFVARTLNDTVARTEEATRRLAIQATHDSLTGLPNRALVLDRLDRAIARAGRDSGLLAVFFVDLDRFKLVNDSLGHDAGDEVLSAVAARLTGLVGDRDTVGRLAGDEFVLICEEVPTVPDAMAVAERVVASLTQPIMAGSTVGAREVGVGASVGIAIFDGTGTSTPEALLHDADVAMYRAKQRGRGRVEIFDDALRVAAEHRARVHAELRCAIEDGQIVVHYQPIVDARTLHVIGFEALARWAHPVRGLLGAGEFIDIAEEGAIVVPLGAAVLAQACTQAATWRRERPDAADLHLAVNVSAAQFDHPSFVETVAAVLARTGLAPDALWLEITETSIMADAEAAGQTLRAIRALGVHLAIDDFGTGYSSLAYLRQFPVEALKVDRSFVSGLGGDREDEAIVAMIVGLARALDLFVVAEGVETTAQLARLDRLGCAVVQGYLFGHPVPAAEAWHGLRGRARAVRAGRR